MVDTRDMTTVDEARSKAYRGIEVLVLLPVVFLGIGGIGLVVMGIGTRTSGSNPGVAILGGGYLLWMLVGLAVWLVTPVLLYLDAKAVTEADTAWNPSPILYAVVGLIASYLTLLHYIYKRHQYVVDYVERDWWWYVVAVCAVGPPASIAAYFALEGTIGLPTVLSPVFSPGLFGPSTLAYVLSGWAILVSVPFSVAIYRDATYVRLHSSDWQPNPGNYINIGAFPLMFLLSPLVYPITGGYYLFRRHRAIGTV